MALKFFNEKRLFLIISLLKKLWLLQKKIALKEHMYIIKQMRSAN